VQLQVYGCHFGVQAPYTEWKRSSEFCLAEKLGGGGQGRYSWTNGLPWWPNGVGAEGGSGALPGGAQGVIAPLFSQSYDVIMLFPTI
jgi:hypothetical protein